jgi:hypothetical protein
LRSKTFCLEQYRLVGQELGQLGGDQTPLKKEIDGEAA